MKIAHVTATFPPYAGGTGAVCYHNALHLARRGHDVSVVTANYPPLKVDYPPEITVHRLPVSFRIGNAPFLPGLFRLKNFDLVHLHFPFIFGQEMLFLKSILGSTRYVITYHQDVILEGMIGTLVRLHERLLGRMILARSERLLFTSLDYANSSRIASVAKSIAPKVVEMPNGVDPERFHPDNSDCGLRETYSIQPDDKVVLFVGGLDTPHYFKGVDVLLKSLKCIADPSVKALIVGDGNLRETFMTMSRDLGLESRVTFCGRVSDELLPAHYALSDLVVLPSTTRGEAFGIVLLEGMATGKPAVASNLPGVRTVVDDGESGLLVKPGDADDLSVKIRELVNNRPLRREMGARGREKVEKQYAWPAVVARLEAVYQEVLDDTN